MKYQSLFPSIVAGKILDEITSQQYQQYIHYIKNDPNSNTDKKHYLTDDNLLLDNPIFSFLKKQILFNAKTYAKHVGKGVEDIQISNSWGVVIEKKEYEGIRHHHGNSLISGVFYLTNASPLLFFDPNDTYSTFYDYPRTLEAAQKKSTMLKVKKGLMILFPSYLEHEIGFTDSDDLRCSIAFNIIPKGPFGEKYSYINFK